jgi:hypothetical protein
MHKPRPVNNYAAKLKDPRWQKRRLEILQRDEWRCVACGYGLHEEYEDDNEPRQPLHVHHRWYTGEPWEAPDEALVTLCESCHEVETFAGRGLDVRIARAVRGKFFAPAAQDIALAFERLEYGHLPEVFATAILWVLTNKEAAYDLADRYLAAPLVALDDDQPAEMPSPPPQYRPCVIYADTGEGGPLKVQAVTKDPPAGAVEP